MPIYVYVCDVCKAERELMRTFDQRELPVFCTNFGASSFEKGAPCPQATATTAKPMRQKVTVPTVHYKGHGWTRTPAIMRDPIAAGHPGQRENWGTGSTADYGDPGVSTPYKHVVDESGAALDAPSSDLGNVTAGDG